jgi:hypothetical protein
MPSGQDVRPSVLPLQRAEIERVACTAPATYGRRLTRWDCRRLADVVVEQAVVDSIHYMIRRPAAAGREPPAAMEPLLEDGSD